MNSQNQLRIGAKLKHARKVKKLRLKGLAEAVGCSESMLSKVENDKISPSLQMLHRIVSELGITIGDLTYRVDDEDRIVMRHDERPVINMAPGRDSDGTELEWLIPQDQADLLAASIHFVKPGGGSMGTISHDGEEMGYILDGELELEVDGKTYFLKQGDSFYFASDRPHGYRNTKAAVAKILWVTTPPTF
ncbi:cupin domain-containing protein [Sneathiella sp.]|uniref:cupin domain-containing protein n=1 Tax=Sneathiella sp. TaxID=1964365 RepID=UPI0026240135|nr:cupin domain-containing protein [Sneathiella sp.]MDF2365653.1 cupin domain-containing protein [Sneathiella sp.]